MCACNAASVTIVDGLQATSPKEKCPLCREENQDGTRDCKAEGRSRNAKTEYFESFLKSRKVERRVQDGFPLMFVCMVALISLIAGYGFHL